MKAILLIFSFCLLAVAWYAFRASGAVPHSIIEWNWLGTYRLDLSVDYRVLAVGFLIALPALIWIFGKIR
jgi:hypothetical protein